MTPEREKEIRELGDANEFALYDAKEELLAYIDQLRSENDRCKEIAERDGKDYADLKKERDQLREKLAIAVNALEQWESNNPTYGLDYRARKALAKIRGES